MLIKLSHQVGTDQPGAIIERPDAEARALIRAGYAEPTRPSRSVAPEAAVKPPGGETADRPGPRT
jgi:hypothetical protein